MDQDQIIVFPLPRHALTKEQSAPGAAHIIRAGFRGSGVVSEGVSKLTFLCLHNSHLEMVSSSAGGFFSAVTVEKTGDGRRCLIG